MMNRIASLAGPRTMLQSIQNANRQLFIAQEQVTTGRRINRVSDNPADAVSSLNQRATLRRMEQFSRNAEEAKSWFDAGDSALSDVSDRLAGVRAMLIQANSGANDAQSRLALANQVRASRESILLAANSERSGRPLFAGNAAGLVAYDASGVYQGDNGTVNLPITGGVSLQVNRTGTDVFGTAHPTDPTQGDVFQVLDALATAIENGDTAKISAGLAQIDAATKRVSMAQVQIGSRASQLEDLTSSLEDSKVSLKSGISNKENVDFAESIINLKTREAAYQAAIQATAKVIQPSLMDFLR
jgi:flagellar hook-associated protein 3 FlgL